MKKIGKIVVMLIGLALCMPSAMSQDTTKGKKSIDITSTFKPVLREASKINFNAAPPAIDSSKPKLTYNIPSQNRIQQICF